MPDASELNLGARRTIVMGDNWPLLVTRASTGVQTALGCWLIGPAVEMVAQQLSNVLARSVCMLGW